MINTLPQYEPVDLERSPIALAVVQLRFPTVLSIQSDEKLIATYQDKIRRRYPSFFPGQQFDFVFGPEGIAQPPTAARTWQFKDTEQNWTITVTSNSVALETRRYTSVSEFADRMAEVTSAAKEAFEVDVQERVGLRYVNEIRHPEIKKPSDWRRFMNPTLLGPLSDDAISSNLESTMQELRLSISNGSLIVRHGAAQGTTVAPELGMAAPTGEFYLLDLDAYDEQGKQLDVDDLVRLVRGYNRTIYSLLRWGMNNQLFEYLRGAQDDQ